MGRHGGAGQSSTGIGTLAMSACESRLTAVTEFSSWLRT
jgi:hypothetical protein